MPASQVESWFPALVARYRLTSPDTEDYNCFAWAANENHRRLDPQAKPNCDWPAGIPTEIEIGSFLRLYESFGFTVCATATHEPGVEKVALYAMADGFPTHAARQLASGKWTSKLGDAEDIEHDDLECLEGKYYGKVVAVLMRNLPV